MIYEYDKKIYEQDFPNEGFFNWKTVKLKVFPYNDCEITGVLLHDGNFMINNILFLKDEYEIIDEDPLKIKK